MRAEKALVADPGLPPALSLVLHNTTSMALFTEVLNVGTDSFGRPLSTPNTPDNEQEFLMFCLNFLFLIFILFLLFMVQGTKLFLFWHFMPFRDTWIYIFCTNLHIYLNLLFLLFGFAY